MYWQNTIYPAKVLKNRSHNTTDYSANQTTGDTSDLNTVIAYPLYKENSPPAYPEIARVRGYEGIVLVFAEILPDGRVGNMKIRKSSGYAILDQSAIEAVKPWKFEPAKKSGNHLQFGWNYPSNLFYIMIILNHKQKFNPAERKNNDY